MDAVELGSTATVIEGRLRDVLEAVAKVTEAQLHHDPRVMMTIQLDVYPGQQVSLFGILIAASFSHTLSFS